MKRATHLLVIITVVFGVACAAMRQQKAQIRADQGEFHNLKVFPQNITHDELIAAMRGFSSALGTKCGHCHAAAVVAAGEKEHLDFPSDAKPEKNTARVMLRMVHTINTDYLSKLGKDADHVACITCHRGHVVPEIPPATENRPAGNAPQTPPPPPPPPSR